MPLPPAVGEAPLAAGFTTPGAPVGVAAAWPAGATAGGVPGVVGLELGHRAACVRGGGRYRERRERDKLLPSERITAAAKWRSRGGVGGGLMAAPRDGVRALVPAQVERLFGMDAQDGVHEVERDGHVDDDDDARGPPMRA